MARVDLTMSDQNKQNELEDRLNLLTAGAGGVAVENKEEFYEFMNKMFQGKNMKLNTELSDAEQFNINKLKMLNKFCKGKVKMIDHFCDWFMNLRVSKDRKGRKEIFNAFTSQRQTEVNSQSWFDKLLGAKE